MLAATYLLMAMIAMITMMITSRKVATILPIIFAFSSSVRPSSYTYTGGDEVSLPKRKYTNKNVSRELSQ